MKLEGDIQEIDLVARLIDLWRERFTGALRFENDGIIKIVYYKEGDILSASTNDRADSVDEILMRAGKVTKEHVKQALSKRKENETLGDALLNLGFITRKELTWARRIQVINVIRSIEEWGAGSFTIVSDYLPKREEGTIFPLPQLIVEMVVTDQDRGRFEQLLESGAVVFEKAPGHEETFRKLGLNEDAEAVIAQVDGTRSASEVAAASRQETFNAFKLMHALSLLGILQRRVPAAASTGLGFESAGVADAADLWGTSDSKFNLEDEPPPSFAPPDPQPPPVVPASSFDEPPASSPTNAAANFPAWDDPPAPARAAAPVVDASPKEEPRWGFDEAQLEAARRAQVDPVATSPDRGRPRPQAGGTATRGPAQRQPAKRESRLGWLPILLGLLVLGAGGWFAYGWWTSRGAGEAPPVAVAPASDTTATAAQPETATETTGSVPQIVTGTVPTLTTTIAPPPVAPVAAAPAAIPASTPPPSRPPAAGSDRARFDSMAAQYASNPSGSHTIQFAIVCEPSNVAKALQGSGGGEVWFTPIQLKERSCYRMFWGRFASREEAEGAMPRLPGSLRESRAAVVTVPR